MKKNFSTVQTLAKSRSRSLWLPIVVFFIILILFSPGFLIKVRVVCVSQYSSCPSSIDQSLSTVNGQKIFFAGKSIKKILSKNAMVSKFNTQFKLPNILKVNLMVNSPVFAWKNSVSGVFSSVNIDGVVLAEDTKNDLPYVSGVLAMPKVGETISSETLLALELVLGTDKMYKVKYGNMVDNTLLIDLPRGIRVIFPLVNTDRDLLLGSLRLIYNNIEKNPGKYSEIDLRYKDPVLR